MQDPDSSLATPAKPFKSSLADPNHPMYSGGLVSLVSGGKLNPHDARRERRRDRALFKDVRRVERGKNPRREEKRARRYGDDYADDLDARIADRRERLQMIVDQRRSGGYGRGERGMYDEYEEDDEARYSARRGFERGGGYAASGEFGEGSSSGMGRGGHRGGRGRGGRGGRGGRRGGPLGMVKRVMREDVLYLMIVNMPSESELREAREQLEMAQNRR